MQELDNVNKHFGEWGWGGENQPIQNINKRIAHNSSNTPTERPLNNYEVFFQDHLKQVSNQTKF